MELEWVHLIINGTFNDAESSSNYITSERIISAQLTKHSVQGSGHGLAYNTEYVMGM